MIAVPGPVSTFVAALGGVRASLFALAAAGLLVALGVQSWRLTGAQRDLALSEKAVGDYRRANESNMAAIASLKKVNEGWATKHAADLGAAGRAAEAAAAEAARLQTELDRARRARGKIYEADPSAAAWSRTRVPSAVADSLRD